MTFVSRTARSGLTLGLAILLAACTPKPGDGGAAEPPAKADAGTKPPAVPPKADAGAQPPSGPEPGPTPPQTPTDTAPVTPIDAGAQVDSATPPAPEKDAGAEASAPPSPTDGGPAPSDGGAIMVGVRTSLREDVRSRWTGTRKSMSEEDGATVFTGVFEANKFGGPQGHNIRLPLRPGREYIFEYRIRFDGNFPFTRGGKIPGLAGGNAPTGCVNVTGAGFSARMMWREGGQLVGYIYDQTQGGDCGNNITTSLRFQPAKWYSIKERVRVNTGNAADGILQISVDGTMLIDRSNMRYMNDGMNNKVSSVLFHSFFGGSTQAWAPARNCSISFSEPFVTLVAE